MNINEGVPIRRYEGFDAVAEFGTVTESGWANLGATKFCVSGFVEPSRAQMDAVFESVSKHGIGRIEGFNIVTDKIKHVPKSIMCHGLKLYPNKRGVELCDWWPGGGMSQQFRSMRTARVFAKSWTNS